MGDQPDDATAALRHVRLRLGTAEDGLDRAIVGLHHIGQLPADWRADNGHSLGRTVSARRVPAVWGTVRAVFSSVRTRDFGCLAHVAASRALADRPRSVSTIMPSCSGRSSR
jgi:hypothetical protein